MAEIITHVIFGPDLEPDFGDIGLSMSGIVPGELGDNWIRITPETKELVLSQMREPRPDEHPAGDACGLCEILKEEHDDVRPAMMDLEKLRRSFC